MKNKIKFHSIYYRFYLFIILLTIGVVKFISNGKPISALFLGYNFTISQDQLTYITLGLTLVIVVIFSIFGYKIYLCKDGIYLRKIDLLVGWDEIDSLSHVWINSFSVRNGLSIGRDTKQFVYIIFPSYPYLLLKYIATG